VLVDTVYGNNATQAIRMHWGRGAAPDSSNGAAVFDTANGFAGVWHLDGATYLSDATVNANSAQITTGTNHNTAGPLDTVGVIGRARQFTDARSGTNVIRKLSVPGSTSLNITGNAITVSLWMNSGDWGPESDGQTTGNRRIICKGNSDNTTAYILTEMTDQDSLQWNLGGVADPPLVEHYFTPINSWRLIHATYNGATVALYVDGVQRYAGFTSGNITGTGSTTLTGNGLHIGGRGNTTARDQFIGQLDEVRVHKVGRDANWVRLEYMNQKLPGFSPVPVSVRHGGQVSFGAPPTFSVGRMGGSLVFGLQESSLPVEVSILDSRGRTVWSRNSQDAPGLVWDGRTTGGWQAARGVYIVRVKPSGEPGGPSQGKVVTYAP
jgi:hypothetical protein